VIRHTAVANEYKRLISTLGVEYSIQKTHTSKTFLEFAKRYFLGPVEITPFPFSALREMSKRGSLLASLLFETVDRAWSYRRDLDQMVQDWYGRFHHIPRRVSGSIRRNARITIEVLKYIRGLTSPGELCNNLALSEFRLPTSFDDISLMGISNILLDLYRQSLAPGKGEALGTSAWKFYLGLGLSDQDFLGEEDYTDYMASAPFRSCKKYSPDGKSFITLYEREFETPLDDPSIKADLMAGRVLKGSLFQSPIFDVFLSLASDREKAFLLSQGPVHFKM